LGADKNRIFLSGHSAGAHLAALLGTNQKYLLTYNIDYSDLAGVIPVDTASFNLLSDKNERILKRLIKQAFGNNKRILKESSPFYNIISTNNYPKFLVLNTTNRQAAAIEGRAFTNKLVKIGCEARFIPINGHTHRQMAKGMYDASDPVGQAILEFILNDA
jgi:acetyl esterase/lipase